MATTHRRGFRGMFCLAGTAALRGMRVEHKPEPEDEPGPFETGQVLTAEQLNREARMLRQMAARVRALERGR